MRIRNLSSPLPAAGADEAVETLLCRPGLRIERIVSHGHVSPPGFWYEQPDDEWVLLVQGGGELEFSDGERVLLGAGDWLLIPAGCRHRVSATDPATVWLAVHAALAMSGPA